MSTCSGQVLIEKALASPTQELTITAQALIAAIGGIESEAAHQALTDSLDAAWAEAEAALPEGETLQGLSPTANGWYAHAYNAERERCDGIADTPAAALRALAAKLREAIDG